jgi:hypothetical protein
MKNTALGLALLAWLVMTRGTYHGMRAFYRRAQEGHPRAVGLLAGPLAALFADYQFSRAHASRARLSDLAITQYADDSLMGYGDEDFKKGGDTLEAQQRGLILPLLKDLRGTVVEIGTGNGDIIAHVAAKYPATQFIGVDFSVRTAERKHRLPNLKFLAGYALDILPRCDAVFMSSTAVVFTPPEFVAYVDLFRKIGVRDIILNEPTWAGYAIDENRPYSEHLEGAVWFHNYPAYLRERGYRMHSMELIPYKAPGSPRPDIRVALIHAQSRS